MSFYFGVRTVDAPVEKLTGECVTRDKRPFEGASHPGFSLKKEFEVSSCIDVYFSLDWRNVKSNTATKAATLPHVEFHYYRDQHLVAMWKPDSDESADIATFWYNIGRGEHISIIQNNIVVMLRLVYRLVLHIYPIHPFPFLPRLDML